MFSHDLGFDWNCFCGLGGIENLWFGSLTFDSFTRPDSLEYFLSHDPGFDWKYCCGQSGVENLWFGRLSFGSFVRPDNI